MRLVSEWGAALGSNSATAGRRQVGKLQRRRAIRGCVLPLSIPACCLVRDDPPAWPTPPSPFPPGCLPHVLLAGCPTRLWCRPERHLLLRPSFSKPTSSMLPHQATAPSKNNRCPFLPPSGLVPNLPPACCQSGRWRPESCSCAQSTASQAHPTP